MDPKTGRPLSDGFTLKWANKQGLDGWILCDTHIYIPWSRYATLSGSADISAPFSSTGGCLLYPHAICQRVAALKGEWAQAICQQIPGKHKQWRLACVLATLPPATNNSTMDLSTRIRRSTVEVFAGRAKVAFHSMSTGRGIRSR